MIYHLPLVSHIFQHFDLAIQKFAVQEARGSPIHRKTWESTAHVSHYRSDPNGYLQALDDFDKSF